MSDPLNNEILDVLSSIRRLVSEERKSDGGGVKPFPRPAEPEAAPDQAPDDARESALPKESRFVLTAALRVGDSAPAPGQADAEQDAASASEDIGAWARDAAEDGAGPIPAFAHDRKPEGRQDTDAASLESTIAELEAAVAGIDEEFEPDGGDAAEGADDPIPDRIWADAPSIKRPGFSGIMASYDAMSMTEERLDAPVTGEVMYTEPAEPFATGWLRTDARQDDAGKQDDGEAEAEESLVAAAGDDGGAPAEPEEMLLDRDPEAAAAVAFDDAADAADESAGDEPEESLSAETGMAAGAAAARLHLGSDDRTRPRIFRADAANDDGMGFGAGEEAEDVRTGDDDDDLLDPLAGTEIDIAMLRDMVVEIIREELRGTLGERITRNVRGLVRREIERTLEAERRRDR